MGNYINANIVILSRTKMSGENICVGAFDLENEVMIRLLDDKARALTTGHPFQIGESYHIRYAQRYQRIPPHIEDVAVYEYQKISDDPAVLDAVVEEKCISNLDLTQVFSGKLLWDNQKGYALESDPPSHSVQIVSINSNLIRSGEYYECGGVLNKRQIKYVGELPITSLPPIIEAGTPIRLSLARPWDKNGDGIKRCYLQLSGAYI
ncbi:hypothetical protein [Rahnella aceris]